MFVFRHKLMRNIIYYSSVSNADLNILICVCKENSTTENCFPNFGEQFMMNFISFEDLMWRSQRRKIVQIFPRSLKSIPAVWNGKAFIINVKCLAERLHTADPLRGKFYLFSHELRPSDFYSINCMFLINLFRCNERIAR